MAILDRAQEQIGAVAKKAENAIYDGLFGGIFNKLGIDLDAESKKWTQIFDIFGKRISGDTSKSTGWTWMDKITDFFKGISDWIGKQIYNLIGNEQFEEANQLGFSRVDDLLKKPAAQQEIVKVTGQNKELHSAVTEATHKAIAQSRKDLTHTMRSLENVGAHVKDTSFAKVKEAVMKHYYKEATGGEYRGDNIEEHMPPEIKTLAHNIATYTSEAVGDAFLTARKKENPVKLAVMDDPNLTAMFQTANASLTKLQGTLQKYNVAQATIDQFGALTDETQGFTKAQMEKMRKMIIEGNVTQEAILFLRSSKGRDKLISEFKGPKETAFDAKFEQATSIRTATIGGNTTMLVLSDGDKVIDTSISILGELTATAALPTDTTHDETAHRTPS